MKNQKIMLTKCLFCIYARGPNKLLCFPRPWDSLARERKWMAGSCVSGTTVHELGYHANLIRPGVYSIFGMIGTPSSSKAGRISNIDKIEAIVKNIYTTEFVRHEYTIRLGCSSSSPSYMQSIDPGKHCDDVYDQC